MSAGGEGGTRGEEQAMIEDEESNRGDPSSSFATTTTMTTTLTPALPPLIRRMPNTAYGIVLGLAGHAILWKTANEPDFTRNTIGDVPNYFFWISAISVYAVVSFGYLYKIVCHIDLSRDEWSHPVRAHFCNAPHLCLILLAIGVPDGLGISLTSLRVVWTVGLLSQTIITQIIYQRWMFSSVSRISGARPQFLLSIVGWFMLSVLGQAVDLTGEWGLNLPAFCFGAGTFFYVMVAISIFNALHSAPTEKGSPSLFLLIAPPSIAAVALAGFGGEFGVGSCAIFGFCLVLLLLFFRIGPTICEKPSVFGLYWAYVFPMASLATASVRYAETEDSVAARVLSAALICLAFASLLAVFCRMTLHQMHVFRGKAVWGDPLLKAASTISLKPEAKDARHA